MANLTLTYRSNKPAVDPYWIRLEPVVVDKSVQADDAAALIDAIYQLDGCYPDQEPQTVDPADNAGLVGDFAAQIFGEQSYCAQDDTRRAQVKVYRSHPDDTYSLKVYGATAAEPLVVSEQVNHLLLVENTNYRLLDKPVVSGFSASWRGATAAPEIFRDGRLLWWDGTVSGALAVGYTSVYDLVELAWEDGDDPAELLAIHHGAADMVQVSPDPVDELEQAELSIGCAGAASRNFAELPGTCYEVVYHYAACQCSGKKSLSHTSEVEVPCPQKLAAEDGRHYLGDRESLHYVDCGESEDVYTPDFYAERCCEEVPGTISLPRCQEVSRDFRGVGVPESLRRALSARYPAPGYALTIIPVGPPPGDVCGVDVTTQKSGAANCCAEVVPLVWLVDVNPETVADNSTELLAVSGGMAPFVWQVAGVDVGFGGGARSVVTASRMLNLVVGDSCGMITVTVTDACGQQCVGGIRSESGQWVRRYLGCSSEELMAYAGPETEPWDGGAYRYRTVDRWRVTVDMKHTTSSPSPTYCNALEQQYCRFITVAYTNPDVLPEWYECDNVGYNLISLHCCENSLYYIGVYQLLYRVYEWTC